MNRILLYLWRETHFVIKTYILFEPTDPNSLFLYILVYKSNAFQSVWITILQIITTQKKLYFSLFTLQTQWSTQTRDLYDFRNVTTAFLNIRKQRSMWFKMFVCYNLSITLYICTVACVYLLSWHFVHLHFLKSYSSTNCKKSRGSQLFDHNRLCVIEPIIITGTLCVQIKNPFGLDLIH